MGIWHFVSPMGKLFSVLRGLTVNDDLFRAAIDATDIDSALAVDDTAAALSPRAMLAAARTDFDLTDYHLR